MTGTPRQHQALLFIKQYVAARGYAPSYQEIAKDLGLASKSGVHQLVTGLEKRRLIKRIPDLHRSIEVVYIW